MKLTRKITGIVMISALLSGAAIAGGQLASSSQADHFFRQAQMDAWFTYQSSLKSGSAAEMAEFVYRFNVETARQSCVRDGGSCVNSRIADQ